MFRFYFSLALACVLASLGSPVAAEAAGLLQPTGGAHAPLSITRHHVDVVINNGFSRTEVTQDFYNPNGEALEAIYKFPVPESASLSELTILAGELELHGEVVAAKKAEQVYESERRRGNDAGLAKKNGFKHFEFRVASVPPEGVTTVRFVYYQPAEVDAGVGRYVYPLREGDADTQAALGAPLDGRVDGTFSAAITLHSSWPVADVRVPGYEGIAQISEDEGGLRHIALECEGGDLGRDLVLYYRLVDDLPGRVEVMSYRADPEQPGTFMMILTPGVDLAPLSGGSDYLFVLDVSGSMRRKIATLADGVVDAISNLSGRDRFRVIAFSSTSEELTRGWMHATEENVAAMIDEVRGLEARGGTNLYGSLDHAARLLDSSRATSLVLVTDADTNTGVVNPARFAELVRRYDVRVFGFLLGSSANWPLMRLIAEESGGFYAAVSDDNDILGQLLLAQGKVTHEAMHDVDLDIRGGGVGETTGKVYRKLYYGQQLVLFGRYDKPGDAQLTLRTRITGEEREYATRFEFPALATEYPELERLWALARIEEIGKLSDLGMMRTPDAERAITELGVGYQLVTDHTSMIALGNEAFADYGIARRNLERTAREKSALDDRREAPAQNHRVDTKQPMFDRPSPRVEGGGGGVGAFGPIYGVLVLILLLVATRRADS